MRVEGLEIVSCRKSYLHSSGHVDGVSKELEASPLSTEYSSRARSTVKSNSDLEVTSIGSQDDFQLSCNLTEFEQALLCKAGHDFGVIGLWIGESGNSNVCMAEKRNNERECISYRD